MRKQYLVILIVVIFVACQEQGSKISPYDLASFVQAEGFGTKNAIQHIVMEVRYSENPDAICDAVQKEIEKFRRKVDPIFGDGIRPSHAYIPPGKNESAGEAAVRRRAYQLYLDFLSSFGDSERECRAIAEHGDNYLGSF